MESSKRLNGTWEGDQQAAASTVAAAATSNISCSSPSPTLIARLHLLLLTSSNILMSNEPRDIGTLIVVILKAVRALDEPRSMTSVY